MISTLLLLCDSCSVCLVEFLFVRCVGAGRKKRKRSADKHVLKVTSEANLSSLSSGHLSTANPLSSASCLLDRIWLL